tara:strand:+ start:864 stop:1844 length:981 start_codon:yes stop_codon:yes gene_type:complete
MSSTKYHTTPENVKKKIKKYGVAIIPNLLNEDECNMMKTGMWDYLEHVSQQWENPLSKDNVNSWKEFSNLYPKHSMLLQQFEIGHTQLMWNLRQNPKCVNVFSKIWDCNPEDLLVSFDGGSFHLPSEITNKGWFRKKWLHTDQSYTRPNFECVQSWVTAYDVNKKDATLSFLEKSNRYHQEFKDTFNVTNKTDWYKLTEEELNFYHEKRCKEKRIACPAGSMVLWDSRTIHCGVEPLKGRANANTRCVVYLCYTPRNLATPKILEKKMKAFTEHRTTNHWPHKPKLFPKNPRTFGKEILPMTALNDPIITDLGKRLAGFTVNEIEV